MSQQPQRKFERPGPMAIRPEALDFIWSDSSEVSEPAVEDGIATVVIRGPLSQHQGWWCDSYESILTRVQRAATSEARCVLLKIHSPGGDAYGVFETSRAIRALCKTAGKQLVAYIDGEACSAAYALASAAEKIYLPEAAIAGSVGVINTLVSFAKQDKAMGVDVVLVTSGERKADGHPANPITESTIAANQMIVNDLAGVFFRWVSEARGIDASALQAGVFVGRKAIEVGLADEIADEGQLRNLLASGTDPAIANLVPTSETKTESQAMSKAEQLRAEYAALIEASKYSEAVGKLAELVEEGDEDARAALKKMANKGAKDGDGEEKKDEPEGKKAEKSDEGEEKKDKEASSAAASSTLDLAAMVVELKNKAAAREEAEERKSLVDSRPDLKNDKAIQAALASASLDQLRFAVKTIPVAKFTSQAAETAKPTRGNEAASGSHLPEAAATELRIQMGLEKPKTANVTKARGAAVFGGSPDQIEERLSTVRGK